jgi:toxin ParE1/3/4
VTRKPVVPREAADRDVEEIIDHYLAEGAASPAAAFVDAFQRALEQISTNPALGSPRYALQLRIPGLRVWALKRFPYLVFYVERESIVEVWRVLHVQRDIPRWLQGST